MLMAGEGPRASSRALLDCRGAGYWVHSPLLTNSRACRLCGSDQSVSLAAAGSSHPFHSAVAAERPATIAPAEQPTYSAPAATRLRISLSSPGWPKAEAGACDGDTHCSPLLGRGLGSLGEGIY